MKLYFLVLLGCLFIQQSVSAQILGDEETFLAAKEQTLNMQANVRFNEFEYIAILKLSEKRILDIKEAADLYNEDRELLAKSIKMINYDFDQEVIKLLNIRQKKAYIKYKTTADYIAFYKK